MNSNMSYYDPNNNDPDFKKALLGTSLTITFIVLMWVVSGGV